MSLSDACLGKIILGVTILLFSYFVIWLTVLPFTELEEDHWLYKGFMDRSVALLFSSIWGFCFIGSLMCFTFYQIYPYIKT